VVKGARLPWLLSLPLMAAGCLGAHSTAYRLIEPAGAEPNHGYLALAPLVLAIGLALGVVGALRAALARRMQARGPAYLFALLPPIAFAAQEQLERALQGGALGVETALEPAFLVGLALQLPFAACALVVARWLVRAAESAGALLLRIPAQRLRPPTILHPSFVLDAPRLPALSSPHAGRAPPLSA
jgi:hypothetical protein